MRLPRPLMPSLLLHLTAIERLAREPRGLHPDFVRALDEDLAYARFGAALPELPRYAGLRGGVTALLPGERAAPFADLFHEVAPVAFGLKMAELVAAGALVGTEAGLAVLAGYFTHLCLDRVLQPLNAPLVQARRRDGESAAKVERRIDWVQAVLYLDETSGEELVGRARLRERFQVTKSPGLPLKGVGGGIYELVRLAAHEVLSREPSRAEVDAWVRGLYVSGTLLASPAARLRAPPTLEETRYYRAGELDVPREVDRALENARDVLHHLLAYMVRGAFSLRARQRFLEGFPEQPMRPCAAMS